MSSHSVLRALPVWINSFFDISGINCPWYVILFVPYIVLFCIVVVVYTIELLNKIKIKIK